MAIDLPGFGHSQRHDALLSPRAMAEFVIRAAGAFGLDHPHLVGPGTGTAAALFAAAAYPERLRSLVVGSGAAAVPLELGGLLKDWVEAPDPEEFGQADPRQLVASALAGLERYMLPDSVREDYLTSYQGNRFAGSIRYVRAYPAELPLLAGLLPQIRTPVQIIAGAHDKVVPPANAEFLHQRLPHSKLDIVDAGHFTWEDAAAEYTALITSWWGGGYKATPRTTRKSLNSQNGGKSRKSMSTSLRYEGLGAPTRTHTLFAQTMAYVAATAALFAAGAYLGRNLTYGAGFVAFIGAFAALIAMRFAARRSAQLTVVLLGVFGLLIGVAVAPTLAYYASVDPSALWQAGGATALFIAGFGAAGYATERDLSAIARVCFWALLALIVFGIVLIFVHIPHGSLIYSVIGLVIFAGFTMFDFQRLRRSSDIASAPFLAASIFLDVLNVFLFFLRIFSGSGRD